MALHAIDEIGPAYRLTREFLLPLSARRWGKLAVVVLFIGGGMNVPSVEFNAPGAGDVPTGGIPTDIPPGVVGVIVAVIALALAIGVLVALIGAIMEFVFVESLRREAVAVRRYCGRRWRQGIRLFAFRLLIALPFLGLVLAWLAIVGLPFFFGWGEPALPIAVFALLLPVILVAGVIYAVIAGFTTVFVVPLMIQHDEGVVASWRRLAGSIRSDWKQYAVYAVIGLLLSLAAGILASIAVAIVVFVVGLPLAMVGIAVAITASPTSPIAIAVFAILVALVAIVVFVTWAIVQVPVVTYLRYHAMLVLDDIDPAFGLIDDQRGALAE